MVIMIIYWPGLPCDFAMSWRDFKEICYNFQVYYEAPSPLPGYGTAVPRYRYYCKKYGYSSDTASLPFVSLVASEPTDMYILFVGSELVL